MLTHALPTLDYSYDALEPYIDTLTMEIHHSRHHQAYITNYMKLLDGTGVLEKYSPLEILQHLDEIPEDKKQGVINNLGGHINHSFFWTLLAPKSGGEPKGKLGEAISATFGDFQSFKDAFGAKALSVFGSGWAWLCKNREGQLLITSTVGQNSPLSEGLTPIIGIDVWEHAYYLKHQNKRVDYIQDFWSVVNWSKADEFFIA